MAMEIRLQLGAPAFWVMLIICCACTGFFSFMQVSTPQQYRDGGTAAVAVCTFLSGFVLLLLPFLFLNVFSRDKQRKTSALLWTRQLAAVTYALGKGGAAALLSLLVGLPPVLVGWVKVSIARGNMQSIAPWLAMLPVLATGDILIALFALLCITLAPVAALGALVCSGCVLYLDIFGAHTLLDWNNLNAAGLYISPSFGFGPDGALLFQQRLLFLALALLFLGLLLLVFQFRERQGMRLTRHWLGTILLVACAMGLVFQTASAFQSSAFSYADSGPTPSQPIQADLSQYRLNVNADPTSGQLQGTATLILTPHKAGGQDIAFMLDPGLHIQQVSANAPAQTTPADIHTDQYPSSPGWTKVDLGSTLFAQGQPVQLEIRYGGHISTSRENYSYPSAGLLPKHTSSTPNTEFMSYLGQGVGFLQGFGGWWYPLPWTQEALQVYGNRLPFEDIQVRLPANVQVFCSLANPLRTADGQWQEIHIQPHGSLPMAFLAMLDSSTQVTLNTVQIAYRGDTLDSTRSRTYQALTKQLVTTARWLQPAGTATIQWKGVVVPLLTDPVIGPGLILLPEAPLIFDYGQTTDTVITRLAGEQIATAWWLNAIREPIYYINEESQTQQAAGIVDFLAEPTLSGMLSAYSAAVTTDRIVGHNFLSQEYTVCKGIKANQISSSDPAQQKRVGDSQKDLDLHQQMHTLGIEYCQTSALALHTLAQNYGSSPLTNALQTYSSSHAQAMSSAHGFFIEIGQALGHDVRSSVAPYVCPAQGKKTSSSSDPLSCLDTSEVTS